MIQTNVKHLLPESYYANLFSQLKKKKEFKKKDNGNWLFAILCMMVRTKSVNFFKVTGT